MNLHDIIRRKGGYVKIAGSVEAATSLTLLGRVRVVRLAPGARIRIRRAHELTALAGFPMDLHWRVLGRWPAGGVRVSLRGERGSTPLAAARPSLWSHAPQLRFNWPISAASEPFDLIIEQIGRMPADLEMGPHLNPRTKLMPLIRGVGVEVGPGLNPQVRPSPEIDVYYVEEKSPEEWREVYGHGKAQAEPPPAVFLERTRQDSATSLEHWAEESLDFVFSNHVFEHLMNPLQVLRNWLTRLRPGGLIVGVIPDARYSFDCRQPLSTLAEIRAEATSGGFSAPDAKYHRWVRYTAPKQDVAKLKMRRYSIHMHYYTPELFHLLGNELRAEGLIDSVFLNTAPNNRDFGFMLRKTS